MADYNSADWAREVSEQSRIRLDKLHALVQAGKNPYQLTRYDVTHSSKQILEGFDALSQEGVSVSIAGRMMSRRVMGKASFAQLLDGSGAMQVYVRRDDVGEEAYAAFKAYDIGDILGVSGTVFKTRTGEISVHADAVALLAKSVSYTHLTLPTNSLV